MADLETAEKSGNNDELMVSASTQALLEVASELKGLVLNLPALISQAMTQQQPTPQPEPAATHG